MISALALGLAAPQPTAAAAARLCIVSGVAYPATIEGSGTIVGTPGADVIVGSYGPHPITGIGGGVCARDGQDDVTMSDGDDRGRHNDTVTGLGGDDDLRGEADDDSLIGGDGPTDSCDGGDGADAADPSCETIIGVP